MPGFSKNIPISIKNYIIDVNDDGRLIFRDNILAYLSEVESVSANLQAQIDNISGGSTTIESSGGSLIIVKNGTTYNIDSTDTKKYISNYSSINDAISDIGLNYVTLVINENTILSSSVTVPDNIDLEFRDGSTIDVGSYTLTVQGSVIAGLWQTFTVSGSGSVEDFRNIDELYPQWWGAKGDGLTDDTEAIQYAINAACYDSTAAKTVRFIPGTYLCHEIDTPDGYHPLLLGDEPGNTRWKYNGVGGINSYIYKKSGISGAFPFGGIKNIRFDGHNNVSATIAYKGLYLSEVTGVSGSNIGVDWGYKIDNVHIQNVIIGIETGPIVNFHVNRIRFDGIGHYCFQILGNSTAESRPVTINQGTWDNAVPAYAEATLGTSLRAAGNILSGTMGRGLLNFSEAYGTHITFQGWRVELNYKLDTNDGNKPALVKADKGSGNASSVTFRDFNGFHNANQGGLFVWCPNQAISMRIMNTSWYYCRQALLVEGESPQFSLPFNTNEDTLYQATTVESQGIFFGDNAILNMGSDPNVTNGFHIRRPDDIVNYNGKKWVASGIGSSFQTYQKLMSNVIAVSGSDSFNCNDSELRNLAIGNAISISGAGISGSNLETTISDIDWTTNLITINNTVSTSITGDVYNIPITWNEEKDTTNVTDPLAFVITDGSSQMTTEIDVDAVATIGRGKIGYPGGGYSGSFGFGHVDWFGGSNTAFRQNPTGFVVIYSAGGRLYLQGSLELTSGAAEFVGNAYIHSGKKLYGVNNAYDIGDSTHYVKDAYINQIYLNGVSLTVDASGYLLYDSQYIPTTIESSGSTINVSQNKSLVNLDVVDYVSKTEVENASGNLQTQIDSIVQESTTVTSSGGTINVLNNGYNYNVEVNDYISKTEVSTVSGSLQSQITSNDNDILNLQSNVVVLSAGIDSNSSDISQLRTEVENVSGYLQSEIDSIVQESTTVTSSGGTIQVLNNGFNYNVEVEDYISKTEVSNITGSLQNQVNSNDNDILQLQTDVVAVSAGVDQLRVEVINVTGNLQSQIISNDLDISNLRADVDEISANYSTKVEVANVSANLQAQIISNDNDISELRTDVDTISGDLDAIELEHYLAYEKTGLIREALPTVSFDDATRTISVSACDFYFRGTKLSYAGGTEVLDNVTQTYFIYFDSNGNLQQSLTTWDFREVVPVAIVAWNSSISGGKLLEERHSTVINPVMHAYEHNTFGARFDSGYDIGSYTLDDENDTTYSIASGTFWDEDIHDSNDAVISGGPYSVWYRNGATEWKWIDTEPLPFLTGVGGYIQYNQLVGSDYQLTEMGGVVTQYTNYYVFGSNVNTNGIFAIPGQSIYSSLSSALDETLASLDFGFLSSIIPELVPLYKITYRSKNNITGAEIAEVTNIQGVNIRNVASSTVLHNQTSGIQGGGDGDFYHLSEIQYNDYIGSIEVANVSGNLQDQIDTINVSISGDDFARGQSNLININYLTKVDSSGTITETLTKEDSVGNIIIGGNISTTETISGNELYINADNNQLTTAIVGPLRIGSFSGGYEDYAGWGHVDHWSQNQVGGRQSPNGDTSIGCATGRHVYINSGATNAWDVTSGGTDANVNLRMLSGKKIYPQDATGQYLGDATHRWDLFASLIDINGNITPSISGAYDLGSLALPFRTGYFTSGSVYLGSNKLSASNVRLKFNDSKIAFATEVANVSGNLQTQINNIDVVDSLNSKTGDLTLQAGTNVDIYSVDTTTIGISASGGSGTTTTLSGGTGIVVTEGPPDTWTISLSGGYPGTFDVMAFSDWQTYTPTFTNFTNLTESYGRYRRLGDVMELEAGFTSAGAQSAGYIQISIPSGLTIDRTSTPDWDSVGFATIYDSGTAYYTGTVWAPTTTTLTVVTDGGANPKCVYNTIPMTWASGDQLAVHAFIKINEWSATETKSVDGLIINGFAKDLTNNFIFANEWNSSESVIVGDIRIPTTSTGYWYECTTAGTTNTTEPTWGTTPGGTTNDGASVVWTCRALETANRYLVALEGGKTTRFVMPTGNSLGDTVEVVLRQFYASGSSNPGGLILDAQSTYYFAKPEELSQTITLYGGDEGTFREDGNKVWYGVGGIEGTRKYIVESDTQSVTFSDLEGTAYRLYMSVENANASSSAKYECYINGDTTSANYYQRRHYYNDAAHAKYETTTPEIESAGAGKSLILEVLILVNPNYLLMSYKTVKRDTSTDLTCTEGGIVYNGTTPTEINTIKIDSTISAGIGQGSLFTLERIA